MSGGRELCQHSHCLWTPTLICPEESLDYRKTAVQVNTVQWGQARSLDSSERTGMSRPEGPQPTAHDRTSVWPRLQRGLGSRTPGTAHRQEHRASGGAARTASSEFSSQ